MRPRRFVDRPPEHRFHVPLNQGRRGLGEDNIAETQPRRQCPAGTIDAQGGRDSLPDMKPVGQTIVRILWGTLAVAVIASLEGCGTEPPVPSADREVLLTFYEALAGDEWRRNDNWATDAPLDEWHGVTTGAEGNVIGLDLYENNLAGPLPPAIGNLQHLEDLSLDRNYDMTGPIPPEIGNLRNLTGLGAYGSQLMGPIPPELGNLRNLVGLGLNHNELTGPIPSEIGNLQDLEVLYLNSNELTGPIPPEIGNLHRLEFLWLYNNGLTGPIPPEIGNLQNLESLWLNDNQLTGRLPRELMAIPLTSFKWSGTDLCAPTDTAFQSWLSSIGHHWPGRNCE